MASGLPPDEVKLGAWVVGKAVRFAARSRTATKVFVCLFEGDAEVERVEMLRQGEGLFTATIERAGLGTRYGLRADGPYDPAAGHFFDPDKLLVDPCAIEIDRPFVHDDRLTAPRGQSGDTAPLVPKGIVTEVPLLTPAPPVFSPDGLIYEINVRTFTMRHPEIPEALRGRIAALEHPAVIAHLRKLGVSAVELMPVVAWIDERHLPQLELANVWGYNPVAFKALDPRLAPGGISDLRHGVAALHEAGIGVILDLVFNHTGESDQAGATLSLRGLDSRTAFRFDDDLRLVNATGTGNTVACDRQDMCDLILDSLRHFVLAAGVDGFRFDLATVLGRTHDGFDPHGPLLRAMLEDPVLSDRILIAEPWDVGPGGYQLGNFPPPFLEWNDRFRDDVRRFWRGDSGLVGALATRLAGSSDLFGKDGLDATRSVNFVAAHDGFTLADLVSYERKHNEANGEGNRDGHDENFSWNNGVEGETTDREILASRRRDLRALLATLVAARGPVMLTAGDEFGRSQRGNNNAYAQDNETTWLDWQGRDTELEDFVAALVAFRRRWGLSGQGRFLTGGPVDASGIPDVEWLSETGAPLDVPAWEDPERRRLGMVLWSPIANARVAVLINGDRRACPFTLPERPGFVWEAEPGHVERTVGPGCFLIPGRSIAYAAEIRDIRKEAQ